MRLAIYAGSFDPFTRGHLEILNGAVKAFDRVLIAVGVNRRKSGLLNPYERIALIEKVLYEQFDPEIYLTVCSFDGLLVDFCKQQNLTPLDPARPETLPASVTIVRGLRAVTDFIDEMGIADANRRLDARFQTVFIPTTAEKAFVSSSVVRELFSFGVSDKGLEPYLTPAAIQHLRGIRWPTVG
jgi:pantetheine-phosphate adenylyltransferase